MAVWPVFGVRFDWFCLSSAVVVSFFLFVWQVALSVFCSVHRSFVPPISRNILCALARWRSQTTTTASEQKRKSTSKSFITHLALQPRPVRTANGKQRSRRRKLIRMTLKFWLRLWVGAKLVVPHYITRDSLRSIQQPAFIRPLAPPALYSLYNAAMVWCRFVARCLRWSNVHNAGTLCVDRCVCVLFCSVVALPLHLPCKVNLRWRETSFIGFFGSGKGKGKERRLIVPKATEHWLMLLLLLLLQSDQIDPRPLGNKGAYGTLCGCEQLTSIKHNKYRFSQPWVRRRS